MGEGREKGRGRRGEAGGGKRRIREEGTGGERRREEEGLGMEPLFTLSKGRREVQTQP